MAERVWAPDWVISPGETLRDWMDENGLTPRLVARRLRHGPSTRSSASSPANGPSRRASPSSSPPGRRYRRGYGSTSSAPTATASPPARSTPAHHAIECRSLGVSRRERLSGPKRTVGTDERGTADVGHPRRVTDARSADDRQAAARRRRPRSSGRTVMEAVDDWPSGGRLARAPAKCAQLECRWRDHYREACASESAREVRRRRRLAGRRCRTIGGNTAHDRDHHRRRLGRRMPAVLAARVQMDRRHRSAIGRRRRRRALRLLPRRDAPRRLRRTHRRAAAATTPVELARHGRPRARVRPFDAESVP